MHQKFLDYVHKNGLILVTQNNSDFKNFSGLKLEDWHVK
jgi:predicted nucleic acid-binding protein